MNVRFGRQRFGLGALVLVACAPLNGSLDLDVQDDPLPTYLARPRMGQADPMPNANAAAPEPERAPVVDPSSCDATSPTAFAPAHPDLRLALAYDGPPRVMPGMPLDVAARMINRSDTVAHTIVMPGDGSPQRLAGAQADPSPLGAESPLRGAG